MWRTKEKIVGVRAETTDLEDLDHIKELAMYIPHHSDRGRDMDDIALLHQELLCFGAYCLYDGVCEQLLSVQTLNAFVEVDIRCGDVRHLREKVAKTRINSGERKDGTW